MSKMRFGRCKKCVKYKHLIKHATCHSCLPDSDIKIKIETPSEIHERREITVKKYKKTDIYEQMSEYIKERSRYFVDGFSFRNNDLTILLDGRGIRNDRYSVSIDKRSEAVADEVLREIEKA